MLPATILKKLTEAQKKIVMNKINPVQPKAAVSPAAPVAATQSSTTSTASTVDTAEIGVATAAAAEEVNNNNNNDHVIAPPEEQAYDVEMTKAFWSTVNSKDLDEKQRIDLLEGAVLLKADITARDENDRTVLQVLANDVDRFPELKAMLALYPRNDGNAKDLVAAYESAKTTEAKHLIANCILTQGTKQDSKELVEKGLALGGELDGKDAAGMTARVYNNYFGHPSVTGFFGNRSSNDNNNNNNNVSTADVVEKPGLK